jgi:hypothetical protein
MLYVRIVLGIGIKCDINSWHICPNIDLISNSKLSNHLGNVLCDIHSDILPLHLLLLEKLSLGILCLVYLLSEINILVEMMLLV